MSVDPAPASKPSRLRYLPILLITLALGILIFARNSGGSGIASTADVEEALAPANLALATEELGREVDPVLKSQSLTSAKKFDDFATNDSKRYTYVYFAGMCYLAAQDYETAEARMRKALSMVPAQPAGVDIQATADMHHRLGRALFFQNRYKEALGEETQAIRIVSSGGSFTKAPEYWWGRAAVEVQLGQKKEAVADLEEALKLNPEHPPSLALQKFLRSAGDY